MGSNRRAAIRRDKKAREKVLKNKSPQARLLQARNKGYEEGKMIATSVFLESVAIDFGWKQKKNQRSNRFHCNHFNAQWFRGYQLCLQHLEQKAG